MTLKKIIALFFERMESCLQDFLAILAKVLSVMGEYDFLKEIRVAYRENV